MLSWQIAHNHRPPTNAFVPRSQGLLSPHSLRSSALFFSHIRRLCCCAVFHKIVAISCRCCCHVRHSHLVLFILSFSGRCSWYLCCLVSLSISLSYFIESWRTTATGRRSCRRGTCRWRSRKNGARTSMRSAGCGRTTPAGARPAKSRNWPPNIARSTSPNAATLTLPSGGGPKSGTA